MHTASPEKVSITDTTLRDAHQSLIAQRLRTEDMLPLAREMDPCGFFSVEAWGGATFDTCIRSLNDDPWDRLRSLKTELKHTPIQMLLRGQNLVGYRHYPDDVVDRFVDAAHRNEDEGEPGSLCVVYERQELLSRFTQRACSQITPCR